MSYLMSMIVLIIIIDIMKSMIVLIIGKNN